MPRRCDRFVGWALLGAAMASGRPVQAAVPLRWEAPAGCPEASQVQAWVDALVEPSASGRARGEVVATAGRFRLTLEIMTPSGTIERDLEALQCEPLARAAAVVVAVAVDPIEAEARASVPQPPLLAVTAAAPTAAARPSPAEPRRSTISAAAPDPPAGSRRWRPRSLMLGAEGGAGAGLLPGAHATAQAWAGLSWRRLEAQAMAMHRFGRLVEQPSGGGASISATTAGVALGPVMHERRWSLRLLAALEAGAMVADGRGLRNPRTAVSPWLGVGLRPGVAWSPVAWLALRGEIGLTASILRPRFTIAGGPLIHQTSLLEARIGLGLEFRIPLDPSARERGPRS